MAEIGSAPHLCLSDDLCRETEAGCKVSIAFDLHDNIVDDDIDRLDIRDQSGDDAGEGR